MTKFILAFVSFGALSGCAAAMMASGSAECIIHTGQGVLSLESDSFTKINPADMAVANVMCESPPQGGALPWASARAIAEGDLLAGFVQSLGEGSGARTVVDEEGIVDIVTPQSIAAADLYIEHSYVLLGGHGQATLDQIGSFWTWIGGGAYGGGSLSCQLGFGFTMVECEANSLGWVVTFGVPFTLVLDITTDAQGTSAGNGEVAEVRYDLSSVIARQNGVAIPSAHLVPIPEPSPTSLVLLGLAFIGLLRLTQRMSSSVPSSVRSKPDRSG